MVFLINGGISHFLWCLFFLAILYGVTSYAYLNEPLPKNFILEADESFRYIVPQDTFKSSEDSTIYYTISSTNNWVKRGVGSDTLRSGFYYFKPKGLKVIQDKYALCADNFFGLRIFDISEPSNISVVSELNLQGEFYDIAVQDELVFLSSGDQGIYIIDISDITDPRLVSDYNSPSLTRGIIVTGEYVIVAEYDVGFRIIDVSDINEPVTKCEGESGITVSLGVFLGEEQHHLLYVAAGSDGLLIYNVTDFTDPTILGSLAMSQSSDIVVVKDVAYMSGYPYFRIVDISDITSPKLLSEMNVASITSRSISLSKGSEEELFVYVTTSFGFKIMNVSNGSTPFVVGEISISGLWCPDIEILNDNVTSVLACFESGLRIADSSTLTNPVIIGEYGFENREASRVVIDDNIAYIADKNYLIIVDVEDPFNPSLLSSTEFLFQTYGITKRGSYVYLAGSDLDIIDVSDPVNPVQEERYSLDTRGHDVSVIDENGKLYALIASESPTGVDVVDITDLGTIAQANFFPLSDVPNEFFVEEYGVLRILYIANRYGGLVILNITDIENPDQLGVVESAEVGKVNGVHVQDEIAYLATASRLFIVNVTDVSNPVVIGQSEETSLDARSVFVESTIAYLGTDVIGLLVFDVSHLTSPRLNHTIWMNSEISDVVVSDGYVYAACTFSGLAIFGSRQLVLYDEWEYTFMCGNVTVVIEAVDSANPSIVATETIFLTRIYNRSESNYCGGMGDCIDYVDCDCDEGWAGTVCNVPECFDVSADDTANVCNGHGDCLSPDECLCTSPDVWYGPNCQYHYNISSVCAGHGNCVEIDHCLCNQGYSSTVAFGECDLFYCNEILFSETEKVCSNRGTCIDHNTCICDAGEYEGEDCETWSCFAIDRSDYERSCSGRGDCVEKDLCECDTGYSGKECEVMVLLYSLLGSSLSIAFVVFLLCLCCVFFVIYCLCTCAIIIFCCCLCGLTCTVVRQKAGIQRFKKLKNFDLLLHEQRLEELDGDEMSAKLKFNKKLFEIDMDELNTESVIGEGGSHAIVFKAIWRGKIVAFKCFKTRNLLSTQDNFNEFEKELEILTSVSHPNIIRFFGACLKPPRVGIVMEFCEKGEILKFVQNFRMKYDNEYPIFQKIRFLEEVASALEYLHTRGVIHRDIKCENVLISEDESSKLMDFGLSKAVERMSAKKTSRIGTSVYMAPEITTSENYDSSCDVFSFAMFAFILLTENEEPYADVTEDEFRIELSVANDPNFRPKLENLKLPPEFDCWMKDLIVKCWSHVPEDRYTCKNIREVLHAKGSVLEFMKKDSSRRRNLKEKGEGEEEDEEEEVGNSSILEEENRELKNEVQRLKKKLKKFERKK